ncbi:hypothetical protein GW17_00061963, partial [Ensete ventricosum]
GVEQFRCAMELAPHNISAHLGLASGLLGWSQDCIKSGAFGWAADLLQGSPYWFILVYRPVGVLLCTNVPCRTESSLSLIESPQIPLLSAVATVVRCSCCLLLLSAASTATAAVVCSTVHCRSQHCHDVAAVYSTVESSSAVRNVHRYCHSQH